MARNKKSKNNGLAAAQRARKALAEKRSVQHDQTPRWNMIIHIRNLHSNLMLDVAKMTAVHRAHSQGYAHVCKLVNTWTYSVATYICMYLCPSKRSWARAQSPMDPR